jgi:hypothetical protein
MSSIKIKKPLLLPCPSVLQEVLRLMTRRRIGDGGQAEPGFGFSFHGAQSAAAVRNNLEVDAEKFG